MGKVLAHRKLSLMVLFIIAAAVTMFVVLAGHVETASAGHFHCWFGTNLFDPYGQWYCVWIP